MSNKAEIKYRDLHVAKRVHAVTIRARGTAGPVSALPPDIYAILRDLLRRVGNKSIKFILIRTLRLRTLV